MPQMVSDDQSVSIKSLSITKACVPFINTFECMTCSVISKDQRGNVFWHGEREGFLHKWGGNYRQRTTDRQSESKRPAIFRVLLVRWAVFTIFFHESHTDKSKSIGEPPQLQNTKSHTLTKGATVCIRFWNSLFLTFDNSDSWYMMQWKLMKLSMSSLFSWDRQARIGRWIQISAVSIPMLVSVSDP